MYLFSVYPFPIQLPLFRSEVMVIEMDNVPDVDDERIDCDLNWSQLAFEAMKPAHQVQMIYLGLI